MAMTTGNVTVSRAVITKKVLRTNKNIEIGDIIGQDYRIDKFVGRGGFGCVYEAVDQRTNEPYAVKIEIASVKNCPGIRLEACVLKRCQSNPHFARFISMGNTPQGTMYIIMQLVGPDLASLRKTCSPGYKFTINTCIRIASECLDCIEGIHGFGLLHRDIKPGNFAIGRIKHERKRIYILDFGLVRRFKLKNDLIRPARIKASFRGTLKYASPNVLKNKESGRNDDLCSYVYMIVEFIKGQLPWDFSTLSRTCLAEEKLQSRNKLLDGVSDKVSRIYDSVITLNYADKPQYSAYRESLTAYATIRGVKPCDPMDWEMGGPFAKIIDNLMHKEPSVLSVMVIDADDKVKKSLSDAELFKIL